MIRFAAIETSNTARLIAALGNNCDRLSIEGQGHATALAQISQIAERNAMRRAIRYPWIFGTDPIKSAYKSIYTRKIARQYRTLHKQLAADRTRTALIFNGFLAPNALLDLAAQDLGMDRLYVENGFFPGTLQADRSGINGLSTLPREPDFYDALSEQDTGTDWPDKFEVRQSKLQRYGVETSLPDQFIFVPFQVPSDMQILALSPWISDMKALYAEVDALAKAFPSQHFVIKEHPSFPRSVQGEIKKHSNIHFANHAVTRDLLEACDGVITVNSTVGLEALVSGKKVITLGNAHYAVEGLVRMVANGDMLRSAVQGLAEWQPDVERTRKFIRFVYNRFLVPGDRQRPTERTIDALHARAASTDEYSRLVGGRLHVASSD